MPTPAVKQTEQKASIDYENQNAVVRPSTSSCLTGNQLGIGVSSIRGSGRQYYGANKKLLQHNKHSSLNTKTKEQ